MIGMTNDVYISSFVKQLGNNLSHSELSLVHKSSSHTPTGWDNEPISYCDICLLA